MHGVLGYGKGRISQLSLVKHLGSALRNSGRLKYASHKRQTMKRTIGSLTLVSYTSGYDWEVYDEDGEFQGMFCGDIDNVNEEEIWMGL